MKKDFEEKLKSFVDSLSLKDIYEIIFFPSRLWRTGKNKCRLSIFSSKRLYNRHERLFKMMLKDRLEVVILEKAKQIQRKKNEKN